MPPKLPPIRVVKPGVYRSAMRDLGYAVKVHSVHEGRVFFTRRGMSHMSVSSIETFRGLVILPEERVVDCGQ